MEFIIIIIISPSGRKIKEEVSFRKFGWKLRNYFKSMFLPKLLWPLLVSLSQRVILQTRKHIYSWIANVFMLIKLAHKFRETTSQLQLRVQQEKATLLVTLIYGTVFVVMFASWRLFILYMWSEWYSLWGSKIYLP